MRLISLFLFSYVSLIAQTATITAPTASQVISGLFTLKSTCTSCTSPAAYTGEFVVNDEPNHYISYNNAGFQFTLDTSDLYNGGAFTVYVIFRDVLGNTIATSAKVTFSIANGYPNKDDVAGYGQPATNRTPSLTATVPAPCTGTISIPITVTGAHAGEIAGGILYTTNVGGSNPTTSVSTVASATPTISLDCTKFYNGTHLISDLANVSTFFLGQAKQNLTFSNGTTNIEITDASRDYFLSGVGATQQLAPVYRRADGTTSPVGSPVYSVKSVALGAPAPTTCTVTAGGLVTLVSSGVGSQSPYCIITEGDGTLSTDVYFYWLNGLNSLHFASDKSIRNSYVGDGKDLFLGCLFFNGGEFTSAIYNSTYVANYGNQGDPLYAGYGADSTKAGINCIEGGGTDPAGYGSYASFDLTLQQKYITPLTSLMNLSQTSDKFLLPILLSYVQSNDSLFAATQGPAASYSPTPATTDVTQRLAGVPRSIAMIGGDEINTSMGTAPLQGTIPMSNAGALTSIVFKSMTTTTSTSITLTTSDCGRIRNATNTMQATYNLPDHTTIPAACVLQVTANGTATVHIPSTMTEPIRSVQVGTDRVLTPGGFSYESYTWNPTSGLWEQLCNTGTPICFTSGTIAIVNWTNWQSGCGANQFLIRGATTANVNSNLGTDHYSYFNFHTLSAATDSSWGGANIDPNHFVISSTAISSDTTVNFASDPNLTIEPNACWWMNPTNGTTDATGDNYGGPPASQYNSFLPGSAWSTFMTQANNSIPGRVAITFPVFGHTPAASQFNWMSDNNFSGPSTGTSNLGFATFYWADAAGAIPIDPTHSSRGWDMRNASASFAGEIRWRQQIMQQPRAYLMQTSAISTNWDFGGQPKAITSCTNEVCIIPNHGLTNVVPGVTRLQIIGSTTMAYNTTYYVVSAPDANTIKIANSVYTPSNLGSNVVANQGTIHWEGSGTTSVLGNSGVNLSYPVGRFNPGIVANNACGADTLAHTGETFSVTNSGDANVNALRFWYSAESGDRVTRSGVCIHQVWRPLPSGSTSNGNAYIIQDNYFHKLSSAATGAFIGPRQPFFNIPWAAMLGAMGVRAYVAASDPQRYYPDNMWSTAALTFNGVWNGGLNTQAGPHPLYDSADAKRVWYAMGAGMRFAKRFMPYLYQPKMLGAQGMNYGQWFDSGFPTCGIIGCLLTYLNISDDTYTLTTPNFTTACGGGTCLQTGQKILKYTATWDSLSVVELASGTTTDTMVMPSGSHVWYLFPANESAEFTAVPISVNPANVSGATRIAIRWGYDTFSIDQRTDQTTDCGTGICTIPVDKKFGTIYYRVIYIDNNTNRNVLAVGDVQSL